MALLEFRSKAAGSVLMLSETFERVCSEAGVQAGRKGCWTPGVLPEVIAGIEAAVEREKPILEARRRAMEEVERKDWEGGLSWEERDRQEESRRECREFVSFAMRSYPLLDMLRKARKRGCSVTWGIP